MLSDSVAPSDCPICLGELCESEELCFCTCASKHVFHAKCARHWVMQHRSCPVCRGKAMTTHRYFLPVLIDLCSPEPEYIDLCSPVTSEYIDLCSSEPESDSACSHASLKLKTRSRRQRCSACNRLYKRTAMCKNCDKRFCLRCKKS